MNKLHVSFSICLIAIFSHSVKSQDLDSICKYVDSKIDTIIVQNDDINVCDTILQVILFDDLIVSTTIGKNKIQNIVVRFEGDWQGCVLKSYANGTLKSIEYRVKGYNIGLKVEWFPNGQFKLFEQYFASKEIISENTIPNSLIQEYIDTLTNNESILETISYRNTIKNGPSIFFNRSGEIILVEYYLMGKLDKSVNYRILETDTY